MSNILNVFRPAPTESAPTTPSSAPPIDPDECLACRITGTVTFAAVGVYAIVQAHRTARTRVGQTVATMGGLGESPSESRKRWLLTLCVRVVAFLGIAAVRWNYGPEGPEGAAPAKAV